MGSITYPIVHELITTVKETRKMVSLNALTLDRTVTLYVPGVPTTLKFEKVTTPSRTAFWISPITSAPEASLFELEDPSISAFIIKASVSPKNTILSYESLRVT